MEEWFSRTELLIGAEGIEKLSNARVGVLGIGGVGGYGGAARGRGGGGAVVLIGNDTG